jgi:hypothetical protein
MGKLIYLAVPGCSLAAIYAFTSWPIYYVLNSRVPTVWNWIASGAGIGLCAGVVWMTSNLLAHPAPESHAPATVSQPTLDPR